MFMSVVARSKYDANGVCIFDGKIDIFPFTFDEQTPRACKNRAKGVIEVKPSESITKFVIKQCIPKKLSHLLKLSGHWTVIDLLLYKKIMQDLIYGTMTWILLRL